MLTIEQQAGNVSIKVNKHHPDTEDPVPCTEYREYSVHYTVLYSTGIPLYIRSTVLKKETSTHTHTHNLTTHPCRVIPRLIAHQSPRLS